MNFIEQFQAVRRTSTPIVAIRTPDPAATVANIQQSEEHMVIDGKPTAPPAILLHDIVRGLVGVNGEAEDPITRTAPTLGMALAKALCEGGAPESLRSPVTTLNRASKMPKFSILFISNAHLLFHDPAVVQAIWNLRDAFKQNFRTLCLLGPDFTLPSALANDVTVLDEPLPDAAQLAVIVHEAYESAEVAKPDDDTTMKCVDATCGLSAFSAEQVCAMSIAEKGMDLSSLWERKRQMIEQTPGLSVWRGGERFSDIGGYTNAKTFLTRVINGKLRPRAIGFIDEIEKAIGGGADMDTSGTSQEMLGTLLTFMQDTEATGLIFIGPPGTIKSGMAKAAGNEANIPTISYNLSAMKGSLVGESGANMRKANRVMDAISQNRTLWIATCNSIGKLPPELRRRFSYGTFFFDLPDDQERDAIWAIYLGKFGLGKNKRPADKGWTGAEIKTCCMVADRLGISLAEASTYIVPVARSAAEVIGRLRSEAHGRFISASKSGVYSTPDAIMLDEDAFPQVGQSKRATRTAN